MPQHFSRIARDAKISLHADALTRERRYFALILTEVLGGKCRGGMVRTG